MKTLARWRPLVALAAGLALCAALAATAAVGASAGTTTTGAPPAAATPAFLPLNANPVPANWKSLPVDTNGLRHAGKFTIYPDGLQVAPNATDADCFTGYTCHFQHESFNRNIPTGWIARYADPTGSFVSVLAQYRDMSSWINRSTRDAAWKDANGASFHCEPNINKNPRNYLSLVSPNDQWYQRAIYTNGGVC